MNNKQNITRCLWTGMFAILLSNTLISCDPLAIEPTTKVDEARFWQNPQLARAYINEFYFIGSSGAGEYFDMEFYTDNCQGNYEDGEGGTYSQLHVANRRYDETRSWTGPWGASYKKIYKINNGIEKINTSEILPDQLKNQLLGECYFFRAWVYFDMEKFWGTVPYVDHTLSLDEETFLPQIKREKLFDNMLADLDKSIDYFKKYGGNPEIGLVNIHTVYSLKSRIALYAADAAAASAKKLYKFNDEKGLFDFEKTDTHYYQIAYDAAKEVIGSGKYSLDSNYANLFTSENAHTSPESIWPVMFKENYRGGFNPTAINGPDGYYYGNSESNTLSWSMRSGLFPTQDLVDCYLQKDKKDGLWKQWWKTEQAEKLNITRNKNGEFEGFGDNYREMYKNRDKRFYSTVTYDGSYMGPESNSIYEIQTWIDTTTMSSEKTLKYSSLHTGYRYMENLESAPVDRASTQTITGYYSRKYSHFDKFYDDGSLNKSQRTTCYFNFRYAEVLLNCAEAAIKLNKSNEAEGYINQIRNRAGVANFNQVIEEHDLWEEMKIQRRLEFAFESPAFRYFDLLRWGESDGLSTINELNKASRGIQIFRKGVHSEIVGENGVPLKKGDPEYVTPTFRTVPMDYSYYLRKFDHVRYYFTPFDITLLSGYKQLQQNPGWKGFRAQ